MSIYENIVDALATVALNEQTGEAKVYREAAPQDETKPFIIFKKEGGDPLMTLLEPSGWVNSVFIFQCWAGKSSDADDLATDLRTAINASVDITYKYELPVTKDDIDAFLPMTDEWAALVKYSFWHLV